MISKIWHQKHKKKVKIDKFNCIKSNKLLIKEHNRQSEKATNGMGKIFTNYIFDNGLIFRIYKELLDSPTTTNSIKKRAKDLNR